MAFCDCNGLRLPTKFKVSISGVTDSMCFECGDINGDYYPARAGSDCSATAFSVSVSGRCGIGSVMVEWGQSVVTFEYEFTVWFGTEATYKVTDIVDPLAAGVMTLSLDTVGNECSWPATITMEAVGPDISTLKDTKCLSPPFPRSFRRLPGWQSLRGRSHPTQSHRDSRRTLRVGSGQRPEPSIARRNRLDRHKVRTFRRSR